MGSLLHTATLIMSQHNTRASTYSCDYTAIAIFRMITLEELQRY
jgi:hypothetical protein